MRACPPGPFGGPHRKQPTLTHTAWKTAARASAARARPPFPVCAARARQARPAEHGPVAARLLPPGMHTWRPASSRGRHSLEHSLRQDPTAMPARLPFLTNCVRSWHSWHRQSADPLSRPCLGPAGGPLSVGDPEAARPRGRHRHRSGNCRARDRHAHLSAFFPGGPHAAGGTDKAWPCCCTPVCSGRARPLRALSQARFAITPYTCHTATLYAPTPPVTCLTLPSRLTPAPVEWGQTLL